MNKVYCRYCHTLKVKLPMKVDEKHRPWNGLRCPDCAVGTFKVTPRSPVKSRPRCILCKLSLPSYRKYYHEGCLSNRSSIRSEGDFIYHGWAD